MSNRLSNFPHLTAPEFLSAISSIHRLFYQRESLPTPPSCFHPWISMDIAHDLGTDYLRITTPLSMHPARQTNSLSAGSRNDHVKEYHSNEEDKVEEDTLTFLSDSDSECFIPPSCSHDAEKKALIQYDIVLSSTYSVPVLYFSIKDVEHRFPPTQHVLYKQIIIPNGYEEQTKEGSVGVLGGVSVADHPITNTPAFFIHPCKTAEVLQASTACCVSASHDYGHEFERGCDRAATDPLQYLILWIGAMGKCVGLNVPLALIMAIRKEKDEQERRKPDSKSREE